MARQARADPQAALPCPCLVFYKSWYRNNICDQDLQHTMLTDVHYMLWARQQPTVLLCKVDAPPADKASCAAWIGTCR